MNTTRKKLIEVALPLDAINAASAREKSIRHGHPSTLHLWWARRPLAAARAVIFAQMVDDPSACPEEFPTETDQENERQRLFRLIEELVKWENTTNEAVLKRARAEIRKSWRRTCADNADHPRASELFDPDKLPAFHDPFAGGGALPLEAQRLGLEAHASDLNPVAVLINKAMIEIPPKFAGRPPVNPESRLGGSSETKSLVEPEWKGAEGLAEDVRYYGQWMRDEAEKRIGHLYPKVEVISEMVRERPDLKRYEGRKLTVIAWLWARTVKSPNPAFADVDVPLVTTFMLSTKRGKEAYVEPVIDGRGYRFKVKTGKPEDVDAAKAGTKLSRGSFACLLSRVPIRYEYIDDEANAGRMSDRLMAIVAQGHRERVYLSPSSLAEAIARNAKPTWKPDAPSRGTWASNAQGRRYGFRTFGHYFTPRQLVALTTFSDLIGETVDRVKGNYLERKLSDNGTPLSEGGDGTKAYAEAVVVYLAFALSKVSNIGSSLASWMNDRGAFRETFARQAIPMVWDFAEANPFAEAGGSFGTALEKVAMVIEAFPTRTTGTAYQLDAAFQERSTDRLVSTDPPYYDNVGYADLSDFFYVWLRRGVRDFYPNLFATLVVPKAEELVAMPYRHGGKTQAEAFFLNGMTEAMRRLVEQAHVGFPTTIYYAFKQSETKGVSGIINTGWETFLTAVIQSGFSITGTLPIRTESAGRILAKGSNALASSIVLVCRKLSTGLPLATRREYVAELREELPVALAHLQSGNIAPVDLAQAAIGPGMAVFTRYSKVLDAQGNPLSVGEALALINQTMDEVLAEQEGEFDPDTRWALAWFEQQGFDEGEYGVAETLSKAKNTSIDGIVEGGILASKGGRVRLLRPSEMARDWDPTTDKRLTVWEAIHYLVQALESEGESAAAELVRHLGGLAETARELAYRLYTICERKDRAEEARSYNGLVQSWPEIARLARERAPAEQLRFLGEQTSRGDTTASS